MTYPADTPRWRRYLRFWRSDVRRDIDDELHFHFETRIEELAAQGMSPADARARAMEEFGDVGQVRDGLTAIDERAIKTRVRTERLREIAADTRYAVRSLRRTPGVALAILATLALGVGANAAMYTLIDTIFVRPPAGVVAPAGARRVYVERKYRDGPQFSDIMSYLQYTAVSNALGDRARTTVYRPAYKAKIGAGESSIQAQVAYAPASYFSLLGVRAMLGRIYSGDEDLVSRAADVALVSEAYWRRELHGDSAIIGAPIVIAAAKYTIIGVAGGGFAGTELNGADVWLPIGAIGRTRGSSAKPWWQNPNVNGLRILVRVAAGASEPEIEQRVQAALRRPGNDYGDDTLAVARFGSIVEANGPGKQSQETQIVVRLAGVAAIVLLIACANVTNLLLARAVRRRREIAVRLALGISRSRLIRLLLAESAVLAVGAAIVAILVAYWGGTLLRTLLLPEVHWAQSPLDVSVVVFGLSASLGAGLLAGLIPAFQAASPELTSALKGGGGGNGVPQSRLRWSLVVAQAALSVVLLVGAMLFVRSLSNVHHLDLGWDSQRLLVASVGFDDRARNSDPALSARLRVLSDQISRMPGVEHVALANIDPMGGFSMFPFFTETDSLGSSHGKTPTVTAVTSGYFAASGLRILRGSDFPTAGVGAAKDVIVSEAMAKWLWPGKDAVGQCMHLGTRASPCYPVRAVVSDSRTFGLIEDAEPKYFMSLDNLPAEAAKEFSAWYVVARVGTDRVAPVTAEILSTIRRDFAGGIPRVVRLSDYLEPKYRPWRLGATLFSIFGVLSLIVAAIGMYSTVSYAVSNRMHEFGVRVALGAHMGSVLRLVVGGGLRVVAVGIAVGLALAFAGGRFVASLLYGVAPRDPVVMVFVAVLLLVVAVIASLVPAWRAARVDPVTALRVD